MARSLRYLFSILSIFLLSVTASAQECLLVEVLDVTNCQATPLGGTADVTVIVTLLGDSLQQGQWVQQNGDGSGGYGIPTVINVEWGDFTNFLSFTLESTSPQGCLGSYNGPNPCFDQCPLEFAIASITGADCSGGANGNVTFTVDNTSPPYVIEVYDDNGNLIDTVINANFIDGLVAGNYSAILYDATDLCQETISFNIPDDSDLVVVIEQSSNPGGGVLLTATTTGGVPPYAYQWSDGTFSNSIIVVNEGIYTLTVTDAMGCQAVGTTIVSDNACLTVTAEITNASCGAADGAISLILDDPDGLDFIWSNGATTQNITDLEPGVYGVEIVNGILCSEFESYIVGSEGPEYQVVFGDIFSPCAVQPGPAAVVIGTPTGPIPDFDLAWVDLATGDTVSTDAENFYPPAGEYQLQLSFPDFPGCSYTENFSWQDPTFEIVEDPFMQDSIACFGPFYSLSLNGVPFNPGNLLLPSGDTIFVGQLFDVTQFGPGVYVAWPSEDICPDYEALGLFDTLLVQPEEVECQSVSGVVYLDTNNDCSRGASEEPLIQRLIELVDQASGDQFWAYSNLDGEWEAVLPLGDYTARVILDNTLFANCMPLTSFTVTSGGTVQDVDLGVQATGDLCPQLTVELNVPLIRRCFFSNVWVSYENTGTVTAEDAQLIIELGEWVDDVAQSPFGTPWDSIVSGVEPGDPTLVYFSVGDVPPFGSGSVSLQVRTCNDDIPLGAAVCVKATGLPNNPCPAADDAWGGASLRVNGYCSDDDEVTFRIRNVGAPMLGDLSYVITEDAVMLRQETVPPVPPGVPYLETIEATGSTYHILVEQEPNHPGLTMPTAFVEGCQNGQSNFATYGFALQIPPNDDAYWVDEDCLEVIGAYDPNDKLAEPRGYGEEHFIEPGVPVEYTIRFQNTGTDTAFNVFIRDTLSPLLDPSTIQLGAASHRFTADIDTAGAINFFFDNIMLPDSFVNEPASHGAVTFRIWPKEDLEPGTVFTNRAGIYFDFNEPIITNDYLLTIERDFISTSVFEWTPAADLNLKVYPNPTAGPAWIELPSAVSGQDLQVVVTDLLGREQLRYDYGPTTQRPGVNLGGLARGWYVLRLTSRGNLLGTGRLLLD